MRSTKQVSAVGQLDTDTYTHVCVCLRHSAKNAVIELPDPKLLPNGVPTISDNT